MSNLSTVSKVLERLVLTRQHSHQPDHLYICLKGPWLVFGVGSLSLSLTYSHVRRYLVHCSTNHFGRFQTSYIMGHSTETQTTCTAGGSRQLKHWQVLNGNPSENYGVSVAVYMGSYICDQTQTNTSRLNPSQWRLVLDLPIPKGWKVELI